MNTEKKELIKKFNVVVEDLLDNYEQYTAGNEQREPLPTMDYPGYTPVVEQPRPQNYSQVTESANSAFGKGLAATIMAEFPVASLIAIFMGAAGLKKVK